VYLIQQICSRAVILTERTHQRTDLVADGVHTLSDVQAGLSVCLLRAGAGFTLLIPPAAHQVDHSVHHTHLHI